MKWLRSLFPAAFCLHENTRCIHGDEINARNGCRVSCRDCGLALDRELPNVCFWTGMAHHGI